MSVFHNIRGAQSVKIAHSAFKAADNRTEIISPANEQYENRSKLLRYHYKRHIATNSAVASHRNKRNTFLSKDTYLCLLQIFAWQHTEYSEEIQPLRNEKRIFQE